MHIKKNSERMAAKKRSTNKARDAFSTKERPTPQQAKANAAKITGTRGPGRPRATHGLKRTSMYIHPDLMQQLKIKAITEGRHVYELVGEAITNYLKAKK